MHILSPLYQICPIATPTKGTPEQSGDIGAKIGQYGPLRGALFIGIRRRILGCPIPPDFR